MPDRKPTRLARVRTVHSQVVERYLPGNYRVTGADAEWVYIAGEDDAGWTLRDYVIPRLQSGLLFCEEIERVDS